MTISAHFVHDGAMMAGLTPAIVIIRDDTMATVASATMTDAGGGQYLYDFGETEDIPYSFVCDGGDALSASERVKAGSFCTSSIPAAIKAKTDLLPADPADESILEAAILTRAAPGAEMTLTSAYDASKTAAQAGSAMTLTGPAIDAILDEVVEGTLTARQILRLLLAFAAGKVTVVGAVRAFRDQADTTDRISGTEDVDGQRSGVTVDGE